MLGATALVCYMGYHVCCPKEVRVTKARAASSTSSSCGISGGPKGVRVTRARADVRTIADAFEGFRVEVGRHPHDLQELVQPPAPAEPLLKKLPEDPWGSPYALAIVDGKPFVRSAGSDGIFGTADDISSRDDKPAQRGGP